MAMYKGQSMFVPFIVYSLSDFSDFRLVTDSNWEKFSLIFIDCCCLNYSSISAPLAT